MLHSLPRLALIGLLSLVPAVGCNGTLNADVDIDANINVTTSIDVRNVMQGQAVPVTVQVTNVTLVEPSATPPAGVSNAGHIQVYLDDVDSTALLVTAQTSFSVNVPAGTSPGDHKLICRVHRHDGTPTTTRFELDLTVRASVMTGS